MDWNPHQASSFRADFGGCVGGAESACGVVVSASGLAVGPTVVSGRRRLHLRGLGFRVVGTLGDRG